MAALTELAAVAQAEMRALIFELRLDVISDHGLVETLSAQTCAIDSPDAHPVQVRVTGPRGRLPLTPSAEEQAYRVAMEAVANAVKHAQATRIDVEVTDLGDVVTVSIADDGVGFDPFAAPRPAGLRSGMADAESGVADAEGVPGTSRHFGLSTMRERAVKSGGTLDLATQPGEGTTVRLTLPATSTPRIPARPGEGARGVTNQGTR